MRNIYLHANAGGLIPEDTCAGQAHDHLATTIHIVLSDDLISDDYEYHLLFEVTGSGLSCLSEEIVPVEGTLSFCLPSALMVEGELKIQLRVYDRSTDTLVIAHTRQCMPALQVLPSIDATDDVPEGYDGLYVHMLAKAEALVNEVEALDPYSKAETDALLAGKADAAQGVYYGEDNNAADLAERPVTVTEGLVLEAGVSIRVHFVNGVTVRGATLNVNGTGAVSMKYRGANFSGNIRANDVIDFVYDGTNWAVIGQFDTDSLVTQLPKSDDVNYHLLCSGSGDIAGTTSYATKNAAFTANPATGVLSATAFQEDDTLLADKYAAKAAQTLPVVSSGSTAEAPLVMTGDVYYCNVTSGNAYLDISGAPGHMRILWYTFGGGLYLQDGTSSMNLTIFKADGTKTIGTSVTCSSAGGMPNFGYFVLDVYKTSATDAVVMVSQEYPNY